MISSAQPEREYGKKELVALITGVDNPGFIGHVDTAYSEPVAINKEDMPKVYHAMMSYKANRIRCYGENGAYTQYFMPAFDMVEQAYRESNFDQFKLALEHFLELVAKD